MSAVQLNMNVRPHNGANVEPEMFEMKRQLWLKACGKDNHKDNTYGRAFVVPKIAGKNRSEDEKNLLEDIYDI